MRLPSSILGIVSKILDKEQIDDILCIPTSPKYILHTTLTKKQNQILKELSKSNFHIFSGAVRSGKTFLALYIFLDFVIKHEGLYIASGNTVGTIKNNFLQILGNLQFDSYKLDNAKNIMSINKSQIILCGASDSGSFKRIRGITASGWYANEVTIQDEELIKECRRRVSTEPRLIIWDCNPSSPHHYIYRNYIAKEGVLNLKVHHFSIYDNEENLPSDYIQDQKLEMSEREQKLYLDGEWVGEGLCPFESLKIIDYSIESFHFNQGIKLAFLDPATGLDSNNSSNSALTIMCESQRFGKLIHIFFGFVIKGGYQMHLDYIFNIVTELGVDFFYYENNLIGENILEMSQEAEKYDVRIASIRNSRPKLARISTLIAPIEKSYLVGCNLGDPQFLMDVKHAELSLKSHVKLDAIDSLESCYRIAKTII